MLLVRTKLIGLGLMLGLVMLILPCNSTVQGQAPRGETRRANHEGYYYSRLSVPLSYAETRDTALKYIRDHYLFIGEGAADKTFLALTNTGDQASQGKLVALALSSYGESGREWTEVDVVVFKTKMEELVAMKMTPSWDQLHVDDALTASLAEALLCDFRAATSSAMGSTVIIAHRVADDPPILKRSVKHRKPNERRRRAR